MAIIRLELDILDEVKVGEVLAPWRVVLCGVGSHITDGYGVGSRLASEVMIVVLDEVLI